MFAFLNTLYVIAVAVLLFNLTIFVHELGHFLVARWRKVTVERFAIWFGPAIWKRTWKGVEYRLGCVPLGGYVAIPQLAMEAIEGKSETPTEQLKPMRARDKIPILLAGSVANVILGFVIACILWKVGVPAEKGYNDLHVGYVAEDSPEYAGGIRPGDRIVSINGKPIENWDDVRIGVALSLSRKIQMQVERNHILQTVEILPGRDKIFEIRMLDLDRARPATVSLVAAGRPAEKAGIQKDDVLLAINGEDIVSPEHAMKLIAARGEQMVHLKLSRNKQTVEMDVVPDTNNEDRVPRIGIGFAHPEIEDIYPTPFAMIKGSLMMIVDTINAIAHKSTTGVGVGDLSGPVGIGAVLYQAILVDFRIALKFLVIININLAVVNLLPIPVLDGGHILLTLIEKIRRRPLNQKMIETTHMVVIVLLLTFMVFVTFNDVKRFILQKNASSNASAPSKPAVSETNR